jgi:hypothetical protein
MLILKIYQELKNIMKVEIYQKHIIQSHLQPGVDYELNLYHPYINP